jgi:hypothetical protein
VQPLIEIDELERQTLRMQKFADKPIVRDPDDPWFDALEIDLLALDAEPPPRPRRHLPITLLAVAVVVVGAALLWT